MSDPVNRRRRKWLLGMATIPFGGIAAVAARTPSGAEGPFYPARDMRFGDIDNDLVRISGRVEQAGGEIVRIGGRVVDETGNPIAFARVEIWQCDANGRYLHHGDHGGTPRDGGFQGFGHYQTGTDGVYFFRTIKPVPYPGRTPHIHVKVLVDGRERLTTQFYLADNPLNKRDWLYRRIPREKLEQVTLRFEAGDQLPQANLDIVI